jgi:hypothetical protein
MKNYILHRPLSDMESDGVYFDESVKKLLVEEREKQVCQYSGLPSVWMYTTDKVKVHNDPDVIQKELKNP